MSSLVQATQIDAPVRVLHLIDRVGRASFGLGPVAMNLAKSQSRAGAEATIWCTDSPSELLSAAASTCLPLEMFRVFQVSGPRFLGYVPSMERAVTTESNGFDIMHQHGIWLFMSRANSKWRRVVQRPSVITPHGSLDQWALRKSWWKKNLALKAYEWENLTAAACLHALSETEAKSLRDFGLNNPIAVIPNGIPEGWLASVGDSSQFRRRFDISQSKRVILFLSRITPKKGLPMFLRALAQTKQLLDQWLFVIAGVDEFNHLDEVRATAKRLGLQDKVRFVGPLYDQDKRDAFGAAELFVLPSHSEGAPLVILEALGAGVPVLATKASPWEALLSYQCGWWTDITSEGLTNALEKALLLTPPELRAMGMRGRTLVEERFSWSTVGANTLRMYEWLLGRASQPEFVQNG